MSRSKNFRRLAIVALALCAGCASYFEVTDSRNGDKYFTDKIDRKDSGLIVFKDAKNGSEVTLPSSSIATITKEEFEAGKYTAPTTKPAK